MPFEYNNLYHCWIFLRGSVIMWIHRGHSERNLRALTASGKWEFGHQCGRNMGLRNVQVWLQFRWRSCWERSGNDVETMSGNKIYIFSINQDSRRKYSHLKIYITHRRPSDKNYWSAKLQDNSHFVVVPTVPCLNDRYLVPCLNYRFLLTSSMKTAWYPATMTATATMTTT